MLSHSVRIKLEGGNNQILHPGQLVTGTVEYKAPPGERITSLNIDFRGVTKIIPKKGSKLNTEFIELFHMGESLLRDPGYFWTESGEKYVWDFSFVIPYSTGPDRSSGIYLDSGNPRFEERVHTLPPSMEDGLCPEVRVEYNMYAVAKEQFQPQSGAMQQENIQTRPVVHNLEQLRLTPDLEHVEHGPPHTYEKHFSPTNEPKRRFSLTSNKLSSKAFSPFTLAAKVPSTVVVGQNITIGFWVAVEQTGQVDENTYVHKLTALTMQARTHRRTAKVAYDSSFTGVSVTKLDSRKASRSIPTNSQGPLLLNFSTDGLLKLPPTFKSYSIAREYHLVLDITMEGEGKREFNTQWIIPVELFHEAGHEQILSRRQSSAAPPPPPMPADLEHEGIYFSNGADRYTGRRGVEDDIGDEDLPPAYEPRRRTGAA